MAKSRAQGTEKRSATSTQADRQGSVIVQISDLHFGTDHDPDLKSVDALEHLLAHDLKEMGLAPNCIVISGDVTTQCQPEGFLLARRFIKRLLKELKKFHPMDARSVVMVPGNHEINWEKATKAAREGETAPRVREAAFQDYRRHFKLVYGGLAAGEWFSRHWTDGRAFVLGLNSCVVEGPARPGIGFVAPEQLEEVRTRWEREWSNCVARIAVIHHHLLPVCWTSTDTTKLDTSLTVNARRVMNWMQEHGFEIVLHGHQHQPFAAAERAVGLTHPVGAHEVTVLGAGSAGTHGERLGPVKRRHYRVLIVGSDVVEVRERIQDAHKPNRFECHGTYTIPLRPPSCAPSVPVPRLPPTSKQVSVGLHWGTTAGLEDVIVSCLAVSKSLRCWSPTLRVLTEGQKVPPALRIFFAREGSIDATLNTKRMNLAYPWNDPDTYAKARRGLVSLKKESRGRVRLFETKLLMTYSAFLFDDSVCVYVPFPMCTGARDSGLIQVLVIAKGAQGVPAEWWELMRREGALIGQERTVVL